MGNRMWPMSLKAWLIEERGRGISLAAHLGVPPSFVSKMASGEKPVPFEHGAAMELFTGGAFSRRAYWPADFARIWPELKESEPNPPQTPVTQAQAAAQTVAQGDAHA